MSDNLLKYVDETMVRLERAKLEAADAAMVAADKLTMRSELLINLLHEYNQDRDSGCLVEALTVSSEIETLKVEVRRTLVALLEADGRCQSMPGLRAELLKLRGRAEDDDDGC
jgi:hypothetical protein